MFVTIYPVWPDKGIPKWWVEFSRTSFSLYCERPHRLKCRGPFNSFAEAAASVSVQAERCAALQGKQRYEKFRSIDESFEAAEAAKGIPNAKS